MKNIVKLIFTTTFILLFLIVICACTLVVHADAAQDYPLKIWKQNENGSFTTLNIVDEQTGVNYVVVSQNLPRGLSIAICPRYNADGSLYVTP